MVLNTELTLLILGVILLTTVLAGTLTSRFGFPALIGFLGLGMLAGIDGPGGYYFENFALTQGIGIACLLFILFSGGMGTDWRDVRRMAAPALLLATVGVLISAAIVTLAAIFILGFGPLQGALLGAVIASTDAAAVFAVLRSTGLDLHGDVPALIETESGSNDPMAIFLVGAVLYLIASPAASPLDLAPDFVIQMAMGALVGVGVGYGMPELLKRGGFSQGGLAFVISIAAALIAFGLAELLAGNGFLASYIAGIVAGNRTYAGRETVSQFQDGMAWLSQVVMFFTLGLLVTPSNLGPAPFRKFGWRSKLFVSWAGLRGAVPIVLATFPMVAGVPGAFTIFNVVFFVVLLSSIIQGPTIKWAAKRLGVQNLGE